MPGNVFSLAAWHNDNAPLAAIVGKGHIIPRVCFLCWGVTVASDGGLRTGEVGLLN